MMLYCPSCDEECEASSSSSMCLTCGDELQTPASNNSTSSARDRNNETARGLAQLLANTMETNNNDDGGRYIRVMKFPLKSWSREYKLKQLGI